MIHTFLNNGNNIDNNHHGIKEKILYRKNHIIREKIINKNTGGLLVQLARLFHEHAEHAEHAEQAKQAERGNLYIYIYIYIL